VQPYHVAHNSKLLFLKNKDYAIDILLKFYLHFTQKYYTVIFWVKYKVKEDQSILIKKHFSGEYIFCTR